MCSYITSNTITSKIPPKGNRQGTTREVMQRARGQRACAASRMHMPAPDTRCRFSSAASFPSRMPTRCCRHGIRRCSPDSLRLPSHGPNPAPRAWHQEDMVHPGSTLPTPPATRRGEDRGVTPLTNTTRGCPAHANDGWADHPGGSAPAGRPSAQEQRI